MLNVDLKTQFIFCQPKAQSSMSTLRPMPFSVDIELNFHVDLLNFDLNNSTHIIAVKMINKESKLFNSSYGIWHAHACYQMRGDQLADIATTNFHVATS